MEIYVTYLLFLYVYIFILFLLCDLQLMISICYEELDELDMRLNLC